MKWMITEESLLQAQYLFTKWTIKEIAKVLRRTESSITAKIHKMGLKRK